MKRGTTLLLEAQIKMFRKSNKKNKSPQSTEHNQKELVKLSTGQIKVKVYRNFGGAISFKMAEYNAIEKRDEYHNLVSINEKTGHNEDLEFVMDDVYQQMNVILEFKNKGREEKLKILDSKIKHQEKLIYYLNKFVELNMYYNFADESLKLKDYRLLRSYISKHNDNGSYFTVEDGLRVYSFESVDGFLVPIWRDVDSYSQYPDHTRKKKINVQEELRFRKEMSARMRDKIAANVLTVAMIITIIMFIITAGMGFKVWTMHNDLEARANQGTYDCVNQVTQMTHNIDQILSNTVISEIVEEKKAEAKANPDTPNNIQKILPNP